MLLMIGCRRNSPVSLKNKNEHNIIAVQPLGKFSADQLAVVQQQLSSFFNIRVLVLRPVDIPQVFRDSIENKYSADSLLKFLSGQVNGSIVKVIGLTHQPIYTISLFEFQENNKKIATTASRNIFGLSLVSGNACVVSDYRLMSANKELLNNRLRKVIIHELGHTLGLEHCNIDICLMSETNGDIANLNKAGGDYCSSCRKKLD